MAILGAGTGRLRSPKGPTRKVGVWATRQPPALKLRGRLTPAIAEHNLRANGANGFSAKEIKGGFFLL